MIWSFSALGISEAVAIARQIGEALGHGTIMAVPVGTGSTFTYGNATKLFDWPTIAVPEQGRTYDV